MRHRRDITNQTPFDVRLLRNENDDPLPRGWEAIKI